MEPEVPHLSQKCPPPVPILSQLHPVPTTPSKFLKTHLNIILPSTFWYTFIISVNKFFICQLYFWTVSF